MCEPPEGLDGKGYFNQRIQGRSAGFAIFIINYLNNNMGDKGGRT